MVYEADPSWEGPHSMPSSFFAASDGGVAAAAPAPIPIDVPFGGKESILNVDAPPKRRKVAFDFSAFQHQHEEAARNLATFSSRGSTATAATAAAARQTAAGGHLVGLGREMIVVTTCNLASDFGAGRVLGNIQPQQGQQQQEHHQQLQYQQQQQDQKMSLPSPGLRVGPSSPAPWRPRLVVGPGRFGGKVGLLDALQPPELTKYLTPNEGGAPKPPRTSRADLSHLTEKEKEDRHRKLSRLNGQLRRKQLKVIKTRLEKEVDQMRTYQQAIDMAPFVMVVLSASINNCRVLHVNKPVTEKLGYEVDKLLGSSFLMMVHPQDRPHLASVLNECIYASQPTHGRIVCRFWCLGGGSRHHQPLKQMDMTIKIGTRGLICNLWEVRDRR